jgi:ABC-type enterochelin transport system substrate-binding protein
MATDSIARIAPYIEQLLDDESARKSLRQGTETLRNAYARSRKQRVKASSDKKLRRQLESAVKSLSDGVGALTKDAQKAKKKNRGRGFLVVLVLAAIGAGVAVAFNDDLRSSLLGSSSSAEAPSDGASA